MMNSSLAKYDNGSGNSSEDDDDIDYVPSGKYPFRLSFFFYNSVFIPLILIGDVIDHEVSEEEDSGDEDIAAQEIG